MSKANNKIVIYSTNDNIFTLKVLKWIIEYYNKEHQIDLILENPKKKYFFKYLLCFLLFSNLKQMIKIFFSRINLNQITKLENVKVVTNLSGNYKHGISFTYPKKLVLKKYKIYNFHLGDFRKQRGIFIFFFQVLL